MTIQRLCLTTLIWGAFCTVATAQSLPGPANPGRVEERFQPLPIPESSPAISIPPPEVVLPPDKAAQTRFVLKGVVVGGSSVYRPADFALLYQSILGKQVSLLDIYKLRDAITSQYRAAGYVLSQAIIPPQQIANGVVRIEVVEGYIAKVEIEGRVNDRRGLIRAMAEGIKRSRPLRVRDLERYVLLIGDLPGVEVSTVLRPSADQPGASDLTVLVKRRSVTGSAEADDRGSLAIGPEQVSAELDVNSPLGLDEQTAVSGATTGRTRELQYYSVRHDEVLNAEGLKLSLSASESRSEPQGAIAPLHPLGQDNTYTVRLSEPLTRSRSQTFTLGGGLTYLNSNVDLLGLPFSKDHVRFLFIDGTYDFADTWLGDARPASTIIRGAFNQGLDIWSASRSGAANLSRANGRPDFTKCNIEVTRLQTLAPRITLALSAAGQFSGDALLSPQQFGLGGARFGRGYEPSELTGDEGVAASIEGRYAPPVLPTLSPQLYAFYDAGIVSLNAPLASEHTGESLASAGVGFRVSLFRHFTAEFELAKPLTLTIASRGNKDVRPLFTISTNI